MRMSDEQISDSIYSYGETPAGSGICVETVVYDTEIGGRAVREADQYLVIRRDDINDGRETRIMLSEHIFEKGSGSIEDWVSHVTVEGGQPDGGCWSWLYSGRVVEKREGGDAVYTPLYPPEQEVDGCRRPSKG